LLGPVRVRALGLVLLFSCGSGQKEDGDGGSREVSADASTSQPAACAVDDDCSPDQACSGAQPGVTGSGRCAPRTVGLPAECFSP
jgi:hypothetical protein